MFSRKPDPVSANTEPVKILKNGDIKISAGSVEEAKLAIKQLKLHKKEYQLQKKAVGTQITQIRAQYRMESTQRGSMMLGGGGLGKFVRIFQRANRDTARLTKENRIVPLEQEKQRLDLLLMRIDDAIIKLEQYVNNPDL